MWRMTLPRPVLLCAAFFLLANAACSKTLPDAGPLAVDNDKVAVTGEYKPVTIEAVDRLSIEGGKLVLHGPSSTVPVDLPANADPDQKNRGWALVTEGEGDEGRTLTFTHETTLEDFTITVPAAPGQVAYGSLGGRDGRDVLIFAYGGGDKSYWGWADIRKKGPPAAAAAGQ